MRPNVKEGARTKEDLLEENEQLRIRLDEAEQTLAAIRSGEVDALVVTGPHGDQVFSLSGAERTYRLIVETMNEAALMVGLDMTILFCNLRFCDLVKSPMEEIIGQKLTAFVAPAQQQPLLMILADAQASPVQRSLTLRDTAGTAVFVQLAASLLVADGQTSICLVASDLTELEAQASSIRVLREQQQALEESRNELQAVNASLIESRRSALIVAEDAINARRQAEETSDELRREVAERKRAEVALRKSEERYRMLFDTLIEGFCIIEVIFDHQDQPVDYRFLEINPAFEAQTGLKNAQGRLMRELAPDHEAHWFEIYGKIALTGEPASFVNEARALNRWFDVSAYRVGKPEYRQVAIVFNEISDRKRAEESLRETMAYLENLLNYANAPIIVWDTSYCVTRFNHAFERLTGLKDDEIIGKPLDMLFPDDSRDESMGLIEKALSGERWETVEIPILHTDGSVHTVLWNSANIHDRDNSAIVATIAQGQDITERKRTEEALQESEARFRTMANAMPQLAWIARADGHIFWYNQRWYDYTGTVPGQMEGWGWQSVHDPHELPKVLESWQASIATYEPFEMTFPMRGADGVFRPFLTRVIPLKDAAGCVLQWFGTNTDVSPLKQAEEQLKGALAEKEVMLREIHHRVKNNLQVISSLVSLQSDSLADEGMRAALADVRDRVRSMALVHEKLYQTGDLAQLNFADYAASLLQHLWRAHGALAERVRLKLEVMPVAMSIEAAVPYGLILNELAGNALKHAFPGNSGGEVTVGLKHDPASGSVCLRVSDNGIGLPAGLDWRQSRSLGLRLVQLLTGQLRGTVETGAGPGAEFRVIFDLNEFQS